MKKQLFLLLAGGIVTLSACESNVNNQPTDDQIDSMVNARVEEYKIELMRSNDSTINALATLRADSIIAAMNGGKSVTTKTTTTRTTTVTPKPTTPDPGAVTTRPGATNTGGPKPTTDRPGATNSSNEKPKPVTDRPGATQTNPK
jgi:hypothetical protein